MKQHTEGITIHLIKYSDSAVISKIFTRDFGLKSFMVRGVRSKKSTKIRLLRPFSILDLEVKIKDSKDIHYIQEMQFATILQNVQFDVVKNSLALFMCEIIYRTIENDYQSTELYDFLKMSMIKLDDENRIGNFHIWFLLELSNHYGFYPMKQRDNKKDIFDLRAGQFMGLKPEHEDVLSLETSTLLFELLGMDFDKMAEHKISSIQRKSILDGILMYFKIHIESLKTINSHTVLQTLFTD